MEILQLFVSFDVCADGIALLSLDNYICLTHPIPYLLYWSLFKILRSRRIQMCCHTTNIFLSIVVAKKTVDLILRDLYFTAGHVYPQQDYDILLLEMWLKMF